MSGNTLCQKIIDIYKVFADICFFFLFLLKMVNIFIV